MPRKKKAETNRLRITLNGKPFSVELVDGESLPKRTLGYCDVTYNRKRQFLRGTIRVHNRLEHQRHLEVLIHEMLHGWFQSGLSESKVARLGRDLSRSLRRMGFVHLSEVVEGMS